MSIYITEQKKKELEAKIAELDKIRQSDKDDMTLEQDSKIEILKEILSEAIVLPDELSWEDIGHKIGSWWIDDADVLQQNYPNGVIIKK